MGQTTGNEENQHQLGGNQLTRYTGTQQKNSMRIEATECDIFADQEMQVEEERKDYPGKMSKEEMRRWLAGLREVESVRGARYVRMRLTRHMVIGIRESSGKKFTINTDQLYDAYLHCEKLTSPEVKKYIFMGHSPALAILRYFEKLKSE